jgi:hypothetical protein
MTIAWRTVSRVAGLALAGAVLCAPPRTVTAQQPSDPAALQQRAKEGERALRPEGVRKPAAAQSRDG